MRRLLALSSAAAYAGLTVLALGSASAAPLPHPVAPLPQRAYDASAVAVPLDPAFGSNGSRLRPATRKAGSAWARRLARGAISSNVPPSF